MGANAVGKRVESFTPREVARLLNVHRYTVYKLLGNGKLRGFRVSNQWRVAVEELTRFMQSETEK